MITGPAKSPIAHPVCTKIKDIMLEIRIVFFKCMTSFA